MSYTGCFKDGQGAFFAENCWQNPELICSSCLNSPGTICNCLWCTTLNKTRLLLLKKNGKEWISHGQTACLCHKLFFFQMVVLVCWNWELVSVYRNRDLKRLLVKGFAVEGAKELRSRWSLLEVFQKRLNPWRPLFFLGKRNFQLCYTYTLNFMEVLRKDFRLFSILIQIYSSSYSYFLWPQCAKAGNVLLTSPFILLYFVYLVCAGCFISVSWGLVPWAGTKPWPPTLGGQHLNHWTTEVPHFSLFPHFSFFKSLNFWQVLVGLL